jgi:hypothetical protein
MRYFIKKRNQPLGWFFLIRLFEDQKENYQDVNSGGNCDNFKLSLAAEFWTQYSYILFHHDPFSFLVFNRLS